MNQEEIDKLARAIKANFGNVSVRADFGWPENPALCVLDCVLSLNRHYARFVKPRVNRFATNHPEVRELSQLQVLLNKHQVGGFCLEELNYKDIAREQTLRGVASYLLSVESRYKGESEWARLKAWAEAVSPSEYMMIGVRGFGLAGIQYLRMLLGVQTTKPDVHVIRFISKELGRPVNNINALLLLEAAAKKEGLPLREVDGAIWKFMAR
jgi:hypothetical protein